MSWFFFSRLASSAVAFIIVVLLARILEPADFGRYNILMLSATAAYAIVLSWAGTATIRFYHDPALETRVLPVALGTVALAVALGVPIAVALGLLLAPAIWFGIAAAAVFCAAHTLHEVGLAGLRVHQNGPQFAMSMVMRPLVGVALAVALVLAGGGGEAALLGMAFGAAVSAALSWTRLVRREGISWPQSGVLRPMILYGLPLGVVISGTIVQALFSQSLIGAAISMTDVGYFAAAQVIAMRVIAMPMITLAQAVDASIFKTVEDDAAAATEQALSRYVSSLLLFSAPLAALLVVANGTLADLIFGSAKAAAIAPFFPPLALAAFLTGLQGAFFAFAFTISKKSGVQLLLLPAVWAAHAVFTWAGVMLFGPLGAAYAALATATVALGLYVVVGARFRRVRLSRYEVRQIGVAVLVAVPFGIVADMTSSTPQSLGLIALGGACFVVALYVQGHLALGMLIGKLRPMLASKQKDTG